MRSFSLFFIGVAFAEETCSDGTCSAEETTMLQMQIRQKYLEENTLTQPTQCAYDLSGEYDGSFDYVCDVDDSMPYLHHRNDDPDTWLTAQPLSTLGCREYVWYQKSADSLDAELGGSRGCRTADMVMCNTCSAPPGTEVYRVHLEAVPGSNTCQPCGTDAGGMGGPAGPVGQTGGSMGMGSYVRGGQDGSCPAGTARVSIEECPELDGLSLSDGTLDVLSNSRHRVDCAAHFVSGAGCFVNSDSNLYSTAEDCPEAQGTGMGAVWAVCRSSMGMGIPQPTYYLSAPGAASCIDDSNVEADECEAAVDMLAAAAGAKPGRRLQTGSGGGCLDGGWGQVPQGCSAQSGGDWAGHFKSHPEQTAECVHSAYQLVCTTPQPTYYLSAPGAASCIDDSNVGADECEAAVDTLAAAAGRTPGRRLQSGSGGGCLDGGWGQVPKGCSAQSGGDWAAHLKTGDPAQIAGCVHQAYQLVCSTPQ